jgi:ADP-heptose:LPS heptosyltransferase
MANTLIIRYHRIGDALMTLPLIFDLATKYKDDTFSVISDERFASLFRPMPSNVTFVPMPYKKPSGLFRGPIHIIRRELLLLKIKRKCKQFDKVAMLQFDTFEKKLHQYLLRKNKQVAISDHEVFMSEERLQSIKKNEITVTNMHRETFAALGYLGLNPVFDPKVLKQSDITKRQSGLGLEKGKIIIAIAPFSREKSKIYPLEKMEKVAAYFANQPEHYQVLILGGGQKEQEQIRPWLEKYRNIISLIDKLSFSGEVEIIAQAHVVLTMDSANLHLASLLNTPVISIWGATVPQNGYYPEKESLDDTIVKNIPCQPCSIFGGKSCSNPILYECLAIDPEIVIALILKKLTVH